MDVSLKVHDLPMSLLDIALVLIRLAERTAHARRDVCCMYR